MTQPLSKLKQAILSASAPTATMLIGVAGSGKSTWIRLAGLETVVISTDDIIEAHMTETATYSKVRGKVNFTAVKRQMMQNLQQAVETNRSFIVDRTNVSRSVRHKILRHIPSHYIRYAAVFMLDRDELNRRLLLREATGKIIAASVIDDMLERYEPPTKAEFDEIFIG